MQSDISNHQSRIFELKDGLEKAQSDLKQKHAALQQVTAELTEAKQVIAKLTAASQAATAAPVKAPPTKQQATAKQAAAPKPAERQSLSLQRTPYSSYKSIPEYAIQRGKPASGQSNSMLSDDDIGWVD
ncbi:MAG: hypothetical protein HC800_07890 [Phormidesmis sp. RL_2_1]|nr:hypothetical protein [Phormidesmis sp. RL_2_1]